MDIDVRSQAPPIHMSKWLPVDTEPHTDPLPPASLVCHNFVLFYSRCSMRSVELILALEEMQELTPKHIVDFEVE